MSYQSITDEENEGKAITMVFRYGFKTFAWGELLCSQHPHSQDQLYFYSPTPLLLFKSLLPGFVHPILSNAFGWEKHTSAAGGAKR